MTWPAILIICLAMLGHVALVRALVTIVYRVHLPRWARLPRLLAIAAFAVVVAIGLLNEIAEHRNHYPAMHWPWLVYLAACLVALPVGAARVLQRAYRPQANLISNRTTLLDARPVLGESPLGRGPRSLLARMPGNELLELEANRKELLIPRLPPNCDGLSILHLSDLHFNGIPGREFFEWAMDRAMETSPDLIALTGDIIDEPDLMPWIEPTLGRLRAPLGCWFVLGNHDVLREPDDIRAAVARLGWHDLTSRWETITHDGATLLLAGTARPWIKPGPDLAGAPPADLRILLSHAPHELAFAARNNFDLMLAGHVHGGQIRLPLLGAIHGAAYDSGTFKRGPTLLHVSRGLAQLTPIRLGCRPEFTKLILRPAPARALA